MRVPIKGKTMQHAQATKVRLPRIGVTGILRDGAVYVGSAYATAIEKAGGLPIILPPTQSERVSQEAAGFLDGLLLPGGPGIVEGLVGDLPDDLRPVDSLRWTSDVLYFRAIQRQEKPVLGICYGMQFINALHGGTIYADVENQVASATIHSSGRGGAGSHLIHPVHDSSLARVIGDAPLTVNTYHVQALASIGAGLRVNAYSEDGVVEGIESLDGRMLGLQFHVERMPGPQWEAVFRSFVELTSS